MAIGLGDDEKGVGRHRGKKILCRGLGGVSMGFVLLGLWLVAAGFRGVGALVVGCFLSFGSGFAGSAGRLWAFLAAVSPFSAVVPFFWLGRAFGSRFFQCVAVRRGWAFPFLLAWSAAARRAVPSSLGVGVYPLLAGRASRGRRRARRVCCGGRFVFLGLGGFFVGLGFLWGSVFRLRVWLGGVSSFLVAVLGLFPFLLAWSWWLRSGAAKHRRRARRRPRYAVGLWGVGGRRCYVVASLVGFGRCLLRTKPLKSNYCKNDLWKE